jgi:hypothetical protein
MMRVQSVDRMILLAGTQAKASRFVVLSLLKTSKANEILEFLRHSEF